MRWNCHAVTDAGKVRQLNEDSIFHNNEQKIWAVADGMGGHHRGDLASQTIVNHLKTYQSNRHTGIAIEQINSLLQAANTELLAKARQEDTGIIASTCAIMSSNKQSVICSWAGDSRIYRYRHHTLTQLTRDHNYASVIEDLSNKGDNTENIVVDTQTLTRGVGAEPELLVEHCTFQIAHGDKYLLCTDGLNKEVSDEDLNQNFQTAKGDEPLLKELYQAYLDGGARDNLGLILVTVH